MSRRLRALPVALWLVLGVFCLTSTAPSVAQTGDVPEVVRSLLEQAARARDAERIAEALDLYRQARELGPQVVQVYVDQGALLARTNDFAAALDAFERGLTIAPDDRDLRYNAAVVAFRLERTEAALGHVEKVVDGYPRDVEARFLHASVLDRLDRPDDALAALRAADGLAPGNARILYRLGNQYQRLGRLEEAVDSYQQAIKKDRKLLPAHFNLGAVLFELGRLEEAGEAYEVALVPIEEALRKGEQVDPANARAYKNLGAIHLQAGDFAHAAEDYGKARSLAPDDAQVLYNLGFAHYRLDQAAAAREAYEAALDLDPELPLAYLHLGLIAVRSGEMVEAVARLEAGVPKLDGDDRMSALRALAGAYRDLGRGGDAESAYRRVLEATGEDPSILLALGRLAREDGRAAEARQLLERARGAAPDDIEVGLELAGVLGEQDDEAAQKSLYADLLARGAGKGGKDGKDGKGEGLWRVRLALALLELAAGDAAEAQKHLDQLARADGVDAESRRVVSALRGVLKAEEGDLDDARKLLRAAQGSTSVAADDALAVVDALDGRPEAAIEVLQASLDAAGGSVASDLRIDVGLLLWSLGRHDEAAPHLRAALATSPEETALRAALGDLALRQGDLWQAIEHLGVAEDSCRGGAQAPSAEGETGRVFHVQLAKAGAGAKVCDWVERALGATRVVAAVDTLGAALARRTDARATRSLVEAALTAPLGPPMRAAGLFVRGTLRLDAGDIAGAAQDLSGALDAGLPASLASHAHNNLGVAYARQGRGEEAQRELRAAREATATSTDATLNLAILLDDQLGDGAEALALYDAYLARGGARRAEVEAWAERLREVYR